MTVYDVIKEIKKNQGLSTRQLAYYADIPPTTLESTLKRDSRKVSVEFLTSLGHVFDVPWHAFLTMYPDERREETMKESGWVPSEVDDAEAEMIIQRISEQPARRIERASSDMQPALRASMSEEELFLQTSYMLLQKLNREGLMAAMQQLLRLTEDPAYRSGKEDL